MKMNNIEMTVLIAALIEFVGEDNLNNFMDEKTLETLGQKMDFVANNITANQTSDAIQKLTKGAIELYIQEVTQ